MTWCSLEIPTAEYYPILVPFRLQYNTLQYGLFHCKGELFRKWNNAYFQPYKDV